jgi:hypothetical protein
VSDRGGGDTALTLTLVSGAGDGKTEELGLIATMAAGALGGCDRA